MERKKPFTREAITGRIIISCLIVVVLTVAGIRLLHVSIENLVYIDHGLFSVITSKGSVNISPEDVLRIERSQVPAALGGEAVLTERIYTKEGFFSLSSTDSFYPVGQQLIDLVDRNGLSAWEHPATDYKTVQPFAYTLGTPSHQITLISLLVSLQYLALTTGGIALIVLIFPLRYQAVIEE